MRQRAEQDSMRARTRQWGHRRCWRRKDEALLGFLRSQGGVTFQPLRARGQKVPSF